jgi:hypothetical protein
MFRFFVVGLSIGKSEKSPHFLLTNWWLPIATTLNNINLLTQNHIVEIVTLGYKKH